MKEVLFRVAVGDGTKQILQLRICLISLYRYFPKSTYMILYNGNDFENFRRNVASVKDLSFATLIDQGNIKSPFNFTPKKNTVWWKWIPIDFGICPIEIVIDSDLVFTQNQKTIINWANSDSNLLVATDPPNLEGRAVSTGNFSRELHGVNTDPINVGIVGMKGNVWRKLFIQKANQILYGVTARSMHIDEQGAACTAAMIGEKYKLLNVTRVPREKFVWFDDIHNIPQVELIHFVAYNKDNLFRYYSVWDHMARNPNYFVEHPDVCETLIKDSINPFRTPEMYVEMCKSKGIKKPEFCSEEDLLPCDTSI